MNAARLPTSARESGSLARAATRTSVLVVPPLRPQVCTYAATRSSGPAAAEAVPVGPRPDR
ncbi:hypothetical protein Afil01_10530 [Actinorhabdospora filicis]|uniref:Uncharacterized protein n=1 Tax=Actinorhabdospora filicis TaxID=1785913 RepID=A0A9W6SIN6_9ACTN|nr:hypothetical protein Afil01_10530 [Actinorhabdospora filicis]